MATQRRFHLLGNLLHFHKFSHETNGTFCLVEAVVAPGAGAPLNRHPGEEEAYIVLEGEIEFVLGDEMRVAKSGELVVVPSGAKHAFKNVGEKPGRMAIFNAPGNVHDIFFSQAGDPISGDSWEFPALSGEPDIPRIMGVASSAGMEIFPPQT